MELSIKILTGVFICVALLMMLVILMQRPKSEGLGAAFGGGVTENIFGAQTTNVLTKITGWLAAFFFILTFVLSILYAQKSNLQSNLGERVRKDLPPAAAITSPTPSPGPSSTVGAVPPTSSSVVPISSPVGSARPISSPGPTTTPSGPAKRKPK